MTFQPGANLYTQGFGSRPENIEVPHLEIRDPSPTDVHYPVGKRWLNTASETEFILYKFQFVNGITQSIWASSVGQTGAVISLQDDSSVKVFPDSTGSIEINGTASQISSTSNPGTHTISLGITNPFNVPGAMNVNGGAIALATDGNNSVTIGNPVGVSQNLTLQPPEMIISSSTLVNCNGFVNFFSGFNSQGSLPTNSSSQIIDNSFNLITTISFIGPLTYSAFGTESVFECNTTGGIVTINLPSGGNVGSLILFYDVAGDAATNNIIINAPLGKNFLQGGVAPSATYTISQNYGSLFIIISKNKDLIVINH